MLIDFSDSDFESKVKNEDVWREFKDEAGGSPHREQNEN